MQEVNPRIMCIGWNRHHLEMWHHGDIDALVKEGKYNQDHLQSTIHSGPKSNNVARKFDQLMTTGKVTVALKLLSTDARGILPLNLKIPCGQEMMVILPGNQ